MTRRSFGKPAPARRGPTPRGISMPPSGEGSGSAAASDGSLEEDPLDRLGYVRERIRAVPDFPKPGILFRDITPLLGDPRAFHMVIDALVEQFIGHEIDAVVAIDSRGFIFGAPLASRLNTSFVPARKPGKLPAETVSVAYALEYGQASLEMHKDALSSGDKVIVIDDLLATGGTAAAAGELVISQGAEVLAYAFVIELDALAGRAKLEPAPVVSLLHF
ncbi:MAG TPA: adenine phosphoribosyltransferase [Polyangiaceae bacterium]|nr:adenine phosphoribosyltransferase [Polyangiaceae bacterium]